MKFKELYKEPSRNGLTKPSAIRGSGIKFCNMGELFANSRIGDIPMELVPVTDREMADALLEEGDLLFARQSLVREGAGQCSVVTTVNEPTTFDSHLIRVRLNQEVANPLFYQYYFSSHLSPIPTIVTQCAQSGIRGKDLAELDILHLPLDSQNEIAETLSRFDLLIENNRKQIKLLEEAAQRLYKEWFIDLHFPGHETTATDSETGLPEGWSRILLGEYAEFRRGKVITEKQTSPGTVPVVAGGLGPAYYHDTSNTTAPVITISGSGANAGFTRLYNEDIWASDCSYVDSTICKTVYFVYETVLILGNGFKYLQRGSAQPHVYPKNINELNIVMPSEEILDNYEKYASCLFLKIRALEKQIALAEEARNRLILNLTEEYNDKFL